MRPEFLYLIDRLDGMSRTRAEDLIKGSAKDYADYKHAVGVVTGLKMAAREIEEYARAYDDEDE